MLKFFCFLLITVFYCYQPRAEEVISTDLITIYSTVCETIRDNESASSTRMRATDKACFKALENIGDLTSYRSKYDAHAYNILIYKLIDTYLEDLTTRTISQDKTQICVEVTGFINRNNIAVAVDEMAEEQQAGYPEKLEIETNALTVSSPHSLPPKPEIQINERIAVEQNINEDNLQEQKTNSDLTDSTKTNVFIEKTSFFNNTTTNAFQQDIAQILEENKYINISMDRNNAEYIIKTKVLRAKVDPINKQTNRLQMVISLELLNTQNDFKLLEHQNRFILFEQAENEQSVATNLLRKLLKKATIQIIPKIKTQQDKNGAIITPP